MFNLVFQFCVLTWDFEFFQHLYILHFDKIHSTRVSLGIPALMDPYGSVVGGIARNKLAAFQVRLQQK